MDIGTECAETFKYTGAANAKRLLRVGLYAQGEKTRGNFEKISKIKSTSCIGINHSSLF